MSGTSLVQRKGKQTPKQSTTKKNFLKRQLQTLSLELICDDIVTCRLSLIATYFLILHSPQDIIRGFRKQRTELEFRRFAKARARETNKHHSHKIHNKHTPSAHQITTLNTSTPKSNLIRANSPRNSHTKAPGGQIWPHCLATRISASPSTPVAAEKWSPVDGRRRHRDARGIELRFERTNERTRSKRASERTYLWSVDRRAGDPAAGAPPLQQQQQHRGEDGARKERWWREGAGRGSVRRKEGREMMATITEESKRSNTATRTSCSRERDPSLSSRSLQEGDPDDEPGINLPHSFIPPSLCSLHFQRELWM